MKLNKSFVTRQFRDSYVMTGTEDVPFKGILNGNSTVAFVVECLKTDTDRDDIISKMLDKYDAPKEIISEDVDKILDALKSIGAIED